MTSIKKINNGVYNNNQNKLYLHTYNNKILIIDVNNIGELDELNVITISNVSKLSSILIDNEVYYLSSNKIYKLIEQNNTIEPEEIQINLPSEFNIVDFDIINGKIFLYSDTPKLAYIYNVNIHNSIINNDISIFYDNMVITPEKITVNNKLSVSVLEIPINTDENEEDFM